MSVNVMGILQMMAVLSHAPTKEPDKLPLNDQMSHTNSILQLIGLVFILVIILVAAYYTTKFVGKISLGQFKNSNFKVIDTYRISPNKFIQIVKIGNRFIVIAVGKDTVNYITELDESEVIMKEAAVKENLTFKQIMERIKHKED